MTADHEAQRQAADSQATDQGALEAIAEQLFRESALADTPADTLMSYFRGDAQRILSALAEAGYTVVKTEAVRWEYGERRTEDQPVQPVGFFHDPEDALGYIHHRLIGPRKAYRRHHTTGPWVPVPEGSADRGSEEGGER